MTKIAHWVQNLPEAGEGATDIARRYALAVEALREAQQIVAELESEAEAYAAADWTAAEIAEARARRAYTDSHRAHNADPYGADR